MIGIETELVGDRTSLRIPDVKPNEYIDYGCEKICWDTEYYDSQIEYKLYPTKISVKSIDTFKKFLKSKIKEGAKVNGRDWV